VTAFDLERFVSAQAESYPRALAELRHGRKASHWMWFIFPQIAGLGSSPMARFYAIASAAEARAYLDHPLLGARLRAATEAMLAHRGESAETILGSVDALKFRSSMTLFDAVAHERAEPFAQALTFFYGGKKDQTTLALLAQ
jgi:uncharacterized protein (DUF1810 family)